MSTADLAREQVTRDLGDRFSSTTTASGTNVQIVDDFLTNFDDDKFVNKFDTWVKLISGTTGGTDDGKIRRVTTKVGNTLTLAFALSGTTVASIVYEVFHLFRPDEYDDAVISALEATFPTIFKLTTLDVTVVEGTYDYDISAGNFQNDMPRQAHIISPSDSEVTIPFWDWEKRLVGANPGIHFNEHPPVGATVRLVGITQSLIADISTQQLLILSARAVLFLIEGDLAQSGNELRRRHEGTEAIWQQRFQQRIADRAEIPPPEMKQGAWNPSTPSSPLGEQPADKREGEL